MGVVELTQFKGWCLSQNNKLFLRGIEVKSDMAEEVMLIRSDGVFQFVEAILNFAKEPISFEADGEVLELGISA